jgi:hypothetical protein
MKNSIRFVSALFRPVGRIVQAPCVGKDGLKSDSSRPIYESELATFNNRASLFDTLKGM